MEAKGEEREAKNVVNHFEAGSNCQVFNGPITGCVFAMPGSNVTQAASEKLGSEGLRHRPESTFAQFIIDPTQEEFVLKRLHELIDGKPPKNCALTIFAARQKGLLTQPSFQALSREFPEIGDRKNYTYYLSRKENYADDINSIEKGI